MRIDQADIQSPTVSAQQIIGNMNLPSGHTYELRGPWATQPHRLYPPDNFVYRTLGEKHYELTDHLGNVRATVTDRKVADFATGWEITGYTADISSAQDYYPFGWTMPGRQYDPGEYRYGFNGKEKDDEIKGTGSSLDFGSRVYDPRIGRFLSMDPKAAKYPMLSPYHFAGNNPIKFVDFDGKDYGVYVNHNNKTITIKATIYCIESDAESASIAAMIWNSQNGKYQYKVGKGEDAIYYDVVLKVSVDSEYQTWEEREEAYLKDNSGEANTFQVDPPKYFEESDYGEIEVGSEIGRGASRIRVRPGTDERGTGAHEVGHSLGIPHWHRGLMKEGYKRGDNQQKITMGMIKQILGNVDIGRPPCIWYAT